MSGNPVDAGRGIGAIVKRAGLKRYVIALSHREIAAAYRRIEKRLLSAREPFGIFIVRSAGARQIRMFVVGSSEFEANLRREAWLCHMVGTYDATADMQHILTDLMEFGR